MNTFRRIGVFVVGLLASTFVLAGAGGPITPGGGGGSASSLAGIGVETFQFQTPGGTTNTYVDTTGAVVVGTASVPSPYMLPSGGVLIAGGVNTGADQDNIMLYGDDGPGTHNPGLSMYAGKHGGGCYGYVNTDLNWASPPVTAVTDEIINTWDCDGGNPQTIFTYETVDDPGHAHPYGFHVLSTPFEMYGGNFILTNPLNNANVLLSDDTGKLVVTAQYTSGPFGPYLPTDGGPFVPGQFSQFSGVELNSQADGELIPAGGIFTYTTINGAGGIKVGSNLAGGGGGQNSSSYPTWFTDAQSDNDLWEVVRTPGGGSPVPELVINQNVAYFNGPVIPGSGASPPTCTLGREGAQWVLPRSGATPTHFCSCANIAGSAQWCSIAASQGATMVCTGGSSTVCP